MNPKQRRFVEEYLVDLNATGAARRAGYGVRSAAGTASRLMANPDVAAAIAQAQAARAERTRVTADRVITELAKVAFGDPRRLLSWGPEGMVLRQSDELSEAEAALVSEVSETRTAAGGSRRVKLHCKLAALTALGRHLSLFALGKRGPARSNPAGTGEGDAHTAQAQGTGAQGTGAEDARERLARRIAGLAARLGSDAPDPPDAAGGSGPAA